MIRGLTFAGGLSAAIALMSAPAQSTQLFGGNGDSADIVFDAFSSNPSNTIAGLSASLRLTL